MTTVEFEKFGIVNQARIYHKLTATTLTCDAENCKTIKNHLRYPPFLQSAIKSLVSTISSFKREKIHQKNIQQLLVGSVS